MGSKRLSTSAIGKEFELRMFGLLEAELRAGRLPYAAAHSRIFHQKAYFSQARQGDIAFDIAIEVGMPNMTPSLHVLVECKKYSHAIPVDDVEEFHAKLQQVGGAVKGILASTAPLQRATEQYAKSKGIGYVRCFEETKLKWKLPRDARPRTAFAAHEKINNALRTETCSSSHFEHVGVWGPKLFGSLPEFLCAVADDLPPSMRNDETSARSSAVVPYLPESELERRVSDTLAAIGYRRGRVNLDAVCRWRAEQTGLTVRFSELPVEDPQHVLGRIDFERNDIEVFLGGAVSEGRDRFTLAHELGHHVLEHGRYLSRESYDSDDETMPIVGDDIGRLEWQANAFASRLLLPRDSFVEDVHFIAEALEIRDRGFGLLYLDDQRCNQDLFHQVAGGLMARYGVSKATVKHRLEQLGFLKDVQSKPTSIRRILG